MSGWRAYIGQDWDDYPTVDWFWLDQVFPSWQEAQQAILTHLDGYEGDSCEVCLAAAAEAARSLRAAAPGLWADEIDGDEYVVAPVA